MANGFLVASFRWSPRSFPIFSVFPLFYCIIDILFYLVSVIYLYHHQSKQGDRGLRQRLIGSSPDRIRMLPRFSLVGWSEIFDPLSLRTLYSG